MEVLHDPAPLPPLGFSLQTRIPFAQILRIPLGEDDGFFVLAGRQLLRFAAGLIGDELMEVVIQLLLVLQAEGDVLLSLRYLVDGHDLPPLEHLVDLLRFGVLVVARVLGCLEQAGEVAVALLPCFTVFLEFIDRPERGFLQGVEGSCTLIGIEVFVLEYGGEVSNGCMVDSIAFGIPIIVFLVETVPAALLVVEIPEVGHFFEQDYPHLVAFLGLHGWCKYNKTR
jgi:hypothetical protein